MKRHLQRSQVSGKCVFCAIWCKAAHCSTSSHFLAKLPLLCVVQFCSSVILQCRGWLVARFWQRWQGGEAWAASPDKWYHTWPPPPLIITVNNVTPCIRAAPKSLNHSTSTITYRILALINIHEHIWTTSRIYPISKFIKKCMNQQCPTWDKCYASNWSKCGYQNVHQELFLNGSKDTQA